MTINDTKREMEIKKIIADFRKELDEKAARKAAERKKIDAELIARHRFAGLRNRRDSSMSKPCSGSNPFC
jgi:hypothetical protein